MFTTYLVRGLAILSLVLALSTYLFYRNWQEAKNAPVKVVTTREVVTQVVHDIVQAKDQKVVTDHIITHKDGTKDETKVTKETKVSQETTDKTVSDDKNVTETTKPSNDEFRAKWMIQAEFLPTQKMTPYRVGLGLRAVGDLWIVTGMDRTFTWTLGLQYQW